MKNNEIKVEHLPNGALLVTVSKETVRPKIKPTTKIFSDKPIAIYGIKEVQSE